MYSSVIYPRVGRWYSVFFLVYFLLILCDPRKVYSDTVLAVYHSDPQISPYYYKSDIDRLVVSLAWFGCSAERYPPSWFYNNWELKPARDDKVYVPTSETAKKLLAQWKILTDGEINNPRRHILKNIELESGAVIEKKYKPIHFSVAVVFYCVAACDKNKEKCYRN